MLEEFKNAFSRSNNAHVQLIIINVSIFILHELVFWISQIFAFPALFAFVDPQFTIPPHIGDFLQRPWTLITYAFMHGGWMHILFNMIALYWFGKLFIEYLGTDKLIALYMVGALSAGVLYLLVFNTIPFFRDHSGFPGMVGASGAIFAIMVAAATLMPNYTFFLLFLGPVRIKYIAAFYVIVSFLGTAQSNAGGNVAHLGGALVGFIYIKQLQVGINWGGWVTSFLAWFKGLFSERPRVKVSYRKSEPGEKKAPASKVSQQEIDAILDKISDGGYESLSKEEREKLFKASKK